MPQNSVVCLPPKVLTSHLLTLHMQAALPQVYDLIDNVGRKAATSGGIRSKVNKSEVLVMAL